MRYIMITGGSLVNKGAQAMIYVTVCEMKKRFPDKEILVVMDLNGIPKEADLNNFNFSIVGNSVIGREALFWLGGIWSLRALKRGVNKRELFKVRKIWKNTDYVMDISGFAIGKKWGTLRSCQTAMKAALAKKFHAHCIFLPQSFGPFDYKTDEKEVLQTRQVLKKWLSDADVLYAREALGKQMLEELGLENVKLAQDIVLQNKEYDVNMIYKNPPAVRPVEIKEKSVGLIPNKHVASSMNNDVYVLWDAAIAKLLEQGYTVYLLIHDNSDLQIIRTLKERHKEENRIILLENDFSCIEYNELVKKFDFMIASRYHSIVHAYRNLIPCVVLGWADKYGVLLEAMNQLRYNLDLRKEVSERELLQCIEHMARSLEENTGLIQDRLKEVQKENVFDALQ